MSATNDYQEPTYEGADCQVPYTANLKAMEIPKPNYNLKFFNKDQEEIGALDFNGPGLAFEGIADLSAITFMDWISQIFMGRLKDERNKARQECLDLYSPDDTATDWSDKIKQRMES
jgi:hypothetical protein